GIEMPDVGGGHRDEVGEAAVAIDADDLRVGTDVRVAGATQVAASAHDVSFGGHPIALLHIGDEAAHLHHVAGELVADGEWRPAAALRPGVPVVDVHIGAAHTRAPHLDHDLIVANHRLAHVAQLESGTGSGFHQRSHTRLTRFTK